MSGRGKEPNKPNAPLAPRAGESMPHKKAANRSHRIMTPAPRGTKPLPPHILFRWSEPNATLPLPPAPDPCRRLQTPRHPQPAAAGPVPAIRPQPEENRWEPARLQKGAKRTQSPAPCAGTGMQHMRKQPNEANSRDCPMLKTKPAPPRILCRSNEPN